MIIRVKKRSAAYGNKGKLASGDRQLLVDQKQELENQKKDISYENITEKGEIQEKLDMVNDRLAKDDGLIAKGKDKDSLVARSKELAGFIKIHIPPLHIQRAVKGTPEYEQALKLGEKALQPTIVDACNEYQDIERRLNPDDPKAGSIEVLVS